MKINFCNNYLTQSKGVDPPHPTALMLVVLFKKNFMDLIFAYTILFHGRRQLKE